MTKITLSKFMAASHLKKSENSGGAEFKLPEGENSDYWQNKIRVLLEEFGESLKRFGQTFQDTQKYPQVIRCIEDYMPKIYRAYDEFIADTVAQVKDRLFCQKTCAACCNHFVASVEPFELLYLDRHLQKSPKYGSFLHLLVSRHATFDKIVSGADVYEEDQLLFAYLKMGLPCPFLNEASECSVYSHRPMPCRMFFSLSHPRLCLGENTIKPENRNFIVELSDEVEVAISQVTYWFRELELPNLFFPGLLKVNEIFGKHAA